MSNYSHHNAREVLFELEKCIERNVSLPIRNIYDHLSIFDWWTETLSVAKMKQMRTFLKEAIKNGYDGYVCFKVGASGCANGMWAHKEESLDGYSPEGDVLYRSFTPDYTYWSCKKDGKWFPETVDLKYNSCKTFKQLLAIMPA